MSPAKNDSASNIRYGRCARSYLQRARQCLSEDDDRFLFYAALELRCCIEIRQADYVGALERFKDIRVKPWKLSEQSTRLHRIWDKPQIASILFEFNDGWQCQTYYAPVTKSLVNSGEKLGELLHFVAPQNESWPTWTKIKRTFLSKVYQECWQACQGQHLAPPIWDRKSRTAHPFCIEELAETSELISRLQNGAKVDQKFRFKLDYLASSPAEWEWECDI